MVPSARQAIACVLFIFIAAAYSQSQVAPAKTATISGKVTLKTKALAGILVAARLVDYAGPERSRLRATTDQSGNYRITNVPPGTYHVAPVAPGLVVEDEYFQKSLVIDEGDNIENFNFSLVRGGVITGKIYDADGRPLIEEQLYLLPQDGPYEQISHYYGGFVTDDRGVYRAFGLRPGKYKVYAGQSDNRMPGGVRNYRQTFFPSVIDPAKATVIEVTEGGEANDIDITLGKLFTAFKVSGKIVDGETGKPLANVRYGIFHRTSEGSSQATSGPMSNANGEFKFEGVMPGKYSVFISTEQNTEVRAEPVPFEIVDHDVTGLVLKTVKASSVSGVVITEGTDDLAAIAKLGNLYVHAMSQRGEAQMQENPAGGVGPDGSFRVSGLSPGVVRFVVSVRTPGMHKPLALMRVERDGIIQPSGVSITDGEQISGLRLIVKTLTATIRGQVKVEDGELPANGRMSIWIQPVDENPQANQVMYMNSNPQIDSRGRFLIEGVAAGTYEIHVGVFEPGRNDSTRIFKQQVTVADNSVSEVTVTIKLKP